MVGSLCWPPLEMSWLDWEGLQLPLGAVTLTGVPSVVTGFMPLAAAGAAGILGGTFKYRMILSDVCFYQEYLP